MTTTTTTRPTCGWFLLCENPADGTAPHPVLGPVLCCTRCASRFDMPLTPLGGGEDTPTRSVEVTIRFAVDAAATDEELADIVGDAEVQIAEPQDREGERARFYTYDVTSDWHLVEARSS